MNRNSNQLLWTLKKWYVNWYMEKICFLLVCCRYYYLSLFFSFSMAMSCYNFFILVTYCFDLIYQRYQIIYEKLFSCIHLRFGRRLSKPFHYIFMDRCFIVKEKNHVFLFLISYSRFLSIQRAHTFSEKYLLLNKSMLNKYNIIQW